MSLFDKYEKVEERGIKDWYRLGVVFPLRAIQPHQNYGLRKKIKNQDPIICPIGASIYLYDSIAHFLFCKMGVEGI